MKHVGKLQAAICLLVVVGFFGVLWLLIHTVVPDGMKEVLLVMLGALATNFGYAVQFALKARTDELLAAMKPPDGTH
jgi:hypothetical protein